MPGVPVHVADVCCHVHCPGHRRDNNGGGDRPPEARCNEREPDEHPGTGRACTGCASRFGLRRQRRSQAGAVAAARIRAARVAALTPAPSV